jgi:hypothetical protein
MGSVKGRLASYMNAGRANTERRPGKCAAMVDSAARLEVM